MGIKSCTNNGNSYSVEFEDGSSVEVIKKYDFLPEDSPEWWWEAVGATSSQKSAISDYLGETVY